jgi:hypothetical protein
MLSLKQPECTTAHPKQLEVEGDDDDTPWNPYFFGVKSQFGGIWRCIFVFIVLLVKNSQRLRASAAWGQFLAGTGGLVFL